MEVYRKGEEGESMKGNRGGWEEASIRVGEEGRRGE
jgi:hypothetical protein